MFFKVRIIEKEKKDGKYITKQFFNQLMEAENGIEARKKVRELYPNAVRYRIGKTWRSNNDETYY